MIGEYIMYENLEELGKKIDEKKGGVHKGDLYCGLYKKNSAVYLVKRDRENPANNIAEYLGSKIFNIATPNYGAEINLIAINTDSKLSTPEDIYLCSTYFKNYHDLYQCAGYIDRPIKIEFLEGFFAKGQYLKNQLLKQNNEGNYLYQNYEKAVVTSLLIGDFSMHSGNLGVVTDDMNHRLVRVDFGASFRSFTSEINPFQSIKNRAGFEKNYIKRDHPAERFFCRDFTTELRRVAQISFDELIINEWNIIKNCFSTDALKQFALRISGGNSLGENDLPNFLIKKIRERQRSLIQMALEIDLAIAIKANNLQKLKQFFFERTADEHESIKYILLVPENSELKLTYKKKIHELVLKLIKDARRKPERFPQEFAGLFYTEVITPSMEEENLELPKPSLKVFN